MLQRRPVHRYLALSLFLIRSFPEGGSLVELLIQPALLGRNGPHFFVRHSLALASAVVSFLLLFALSDKVASVLADLDPRGLIDHFIKRVLIVVGLVAAEPSFFVDMLQLVLERVVLGIWCHLEVELIFVSLLITALEVWVDLLVGLADEAN